MSPKKFKFDFSISFAGPQRRIAEELSKALTSRGYRVFYDDSYRARLLGRNLSREFEWIFGSTVFFIPIVSRDYLERHWPQLEWSIAKEEASGRDYEFILPVRYDDARLLGLPDYIGYVDLREHDIQRVVSILCKKFDEMSAEAPEYREVTKWVATFGVIIRDVMSNENLPKAVPKDYPRLCDWLEQDLTDRLIGNGFGDAAFSEASLRTGETLSARVSFTWNPAQSPLNFGDIVWWEVLEVVPYEELYGQ